VDDFITSQESKGVVISREHLNNLENVLEVFWSVGGPWLQIVQVLVQQRAVDIENEVDAGGSQQGHTLVVVDIWIDGVNTDGVDS